MQFNVRAQNHSCASPCWWATGAARYRDVFLSFMSFIPAFSLFLSNVRSHLLHGEEQKEQSTERRPHSNIFIYVVLTWLNFPFKRLMRRNGLVEEPTGCIHSCHHHLNPGLLNLQLWPPTWMGNDLSVLDWHPLCLQQNHSSSIHKSSTAQLNPISVVRLVICNVKTDMGSDLNL